jgi:hypothetical protein
MNPALFTELLYATPPIEAFANTIRQWYRAAIPGGLIYGPSRAGKSVAIEYVVQCREAIFGYDIPIIVVLWKKAAMAEKEFHERFLNACGHAVPSDGSPNSWLERRLVQYLDSWVSRSGSRNLIVFIDDAQDLSLRQLGYLSNIYNLLKRRKVQQFTFLVGERSLVSLRDKAKLEGSERYVGRFMWADFEFPLLESKADLRFVMEQYDTAEYPKGSGVSIVGQVLPKAVASGWRLVDQVDAIWGKYREGNRTAGKRRGGMRMQSCTSLVARLLQLLSTRDGHDLILTEEELEEAIFMAMYVYDG